MRDWNRTIAKNVVLPTTSGKTIAAKYGSDVPIPKCTWTHLMQERAQHSSELGSAIDEEMPHKIQLIVVRKLANTVQGT